MVEVHEQRPGGGRRVGQAGRRRDVRKPAPTHVPKQGPPPAAGRDVQVDPSIVVVIAERGRGGAIAQHDARARRGFDEPPLVTAKQMTRDEQILRLIIVVIAHREGHGALERTGQAVGERLHALEPAPGCDISEPDLRGHRPSVLGGNRQVRVERQDGIADQWVAPAAEVLQADLIRGGDFHRLMEALRRSRGLGRSPRPRRTEGALEEARGLSRQLRQLALQNLELGGRIVGGTAREQEVHQLEPRRDVRRSAGDHLAQVTLLALPLLRIGRAPGELSGSVQRPDVGGIAAQYSLDLAARLRLPPGQLVHFGEHQPDIAVG